MYKLGDRFNARCSSIKTKITNIVYGNQKYVEYELTDINDAQRKFMETSDTIDTWWIIEPGFYSTSMGSVYLDTVDKDYIEITSLPVFDRQFGEDMFDVSVYSSRFGTRYGYRRRSQLDQMQYVGSRSDQKILNMIQTVLGPNSLNQAANSMGLNRQPGASPALGAPYKSNANSESITNRCFHVMVPYVGFTESYKYCTKCGEKE